MARSRRPRFRRTRARRAAAPSLPPEAVAGLANRPPRRARGIYLLPNAFTTGALFGGFFAVVQAMNGEFIVAAIATFVAMMLDGLDGRVARLTNTQSAFGEQYDSLSDMVSFGVAPALIMYEWALHDLGKMGWLAAFIYVAGAALRLARFNTNLAVVDRRFFQGLPSPAAAALVVGLVWLAADLRESRLITLTGKDLSWLAWIVTVYAGLTMVSSAPFYSFKTINLRKSVPFVAALVLVLVFVLVSSDPPSVLFALFLCYGLSGHVIWLARLRRRGWSWRGTRAVPPAADADAHDPDVADTDALQAGSQARRRPSDEDSRV